MQPESFRDLMRLVHGFESAKIVLVANDLDLFNQLDDGKSVAVLAAELGLNARALGLLLNALVALGLLHKNGDAYCNTAVSNQFLAGSGYRGHIFRHIHHCWESWNHLADVLKQGAPQEVRETSILHDEEAWNRDFIRGMDDVTRELAPQVAGQLELGSAKRLLDVGGGPGTYARAFLTQHAQLAEVTILDLPMALQVAGERLAGFERREAVRLQAGDFHDADFGGGYDVVWISQVFHSQDESACRMLIDKAWQALNPGGRLVVHEFLLDEHKTGPLTPALFAVHMLVMTQAGRAYSGEEISNWMTERGFTGADVRKVSDDTGVVIGIKP